MRLLFGYEGLLNECEFLTESYIPNDASHSIIETVNNVNIKEYIDIQKSNDSNVRKKFMLKGIMLQSEVRNRNGRRYPKHIIERELNRYVKDMVRTNSAVGTLGHDDTPNVKEDRVCHIIRELKMDGHNGIGIAEIVEDFPMGRIAKTYVEEKIRCGMSSRGVGDIDGDTVGDNYNLLSIDFVLTPSAPQAYMESVIENKNYIVSGDSYVEMAIENMKREAGKTANMYDTQKVNEALYNTLMQFIENIQNKNTKNKKSLKI